MYGAEGSLDRMPGARGPHPNRVASEVEEAILAHALAHPTHRVADELMLRGRSGELGRRQRGVDPPRADEAARAVRIPTKPTADSDKPIGDSGACRSPWRSGGP